MLLDVCGSKGCLSTHTTPAFRRKLVEVARAIGTDPDYLSTVIAFETAGTFDPAIKNPYSSATGLIQFIGPTARKLGTTTDALAQMSPEQQLDYVYLYFAELLKGPYPTLDRLYLTVFSPAFRDRPLDSIAYQAPSKEYEQNRGFDPSGRGYFTVGDITSAVRGIYNRAQSKPRVPVPGSSALSLVVAGAAIGVIGLYTYIFRDDLNKLLLRG
jgi:hypothetical protein